MNIETVLWLASFAGAASFLVAGLLLGRGSRARLTDACDRLKAEAEGQRKHDFAARVALQEEAEVLRVELVERAERIHTLETSLLQTQSEATAVRAQHAQQTEQIRQLAELDAKAREAEKTLRHDLAVAGESLRKQSDQLRRFADSNTGLRVELEALTARAAHNEALEREVEQLRMRAFVSHVSDASSPATPPTPGPHAFDAIAAELVSLPAVRAAVIGDDLGLVVSCQGSHGDELAALGALFNRACSEARRILPLGRILRISIEDEGRICVTMRPLRSATATGDDDQLTLVTLAHGFEPDAARVARILTRAASHDADAVLAT
jgi:hypothetical protein